ncbi:regulator of G-protein signaling protein-like, partial [Saccostrea cucullata]|uniref:regulator of G-protein signaling protein-like n=1 Tax=Saccostrea cuccullata TaxID=36930 RepID=UPI002ECFB148
PKIPTNEELAFLLEDRAFADYFNVFLTLPVFGQQIFYNFIEKGFVFEPPIKKKKNHVDRRCVYTFLTQERYPLFENTSLFHEYLLCCRLRDVEVDFQSRTFKEESEKKTVFARNVLGHVRGMQMFREYIRGTAGENVFRCWIDIEKWKRSEGTELQKTEMAHNIKITYLSEGSVCDLRTRGKRLVFEGKMDFELIPEKEIYDEILEAVCQMDVLYTVEPRDAFENLQRILLSALRRYWVPRYFIHLYHIGTPQTIAFLMRETPFDVGTVAQQRKLRCRIMFPRVYSASRSSPGSPTTPVFLSCDADKFPESAYSLTSSDMRTQTPDDVEFDTLSPDRNIEPLELLSLWSGQGYSTQRYSVKSGGMSGGKRNETDDTYGLKELEAWEKAESSRLLRGSPMLYVIPLPVNSYVKGRRRLKFECATLDKNSKLMAALASDALAGSPYSQFLKKSQMLLDSRMFEFWSDVRRYIDADETYLDPYGIPVKRKIARRITDKYLIFNNDLEYDIFSDQLKMTLFQSMSSRDDISLISNTQSIISHALGESWRQYSREERTSFRMKVCSSKMFDRNIIEIPPGSASSRGQSDPLFFINTNVQSPTGQAIQGTDETPVLSTSPVDTNSPYSRLTTDLMNLTITEEHSLKSMEYAVLCAEYGRCGMFPQTPAKIDDLTDVLYSDYGSLHIKREPAKRHEFLHNLLHKPKINIETIQVSRRVILDTPEVTALEKVHYRSRLQRLVLRRRGILIERPTRPRNLMEVLQSPVHYEFFKRFMMGNKTVHPLLFWKYVEDLKEAQSARHRNHLISVIYRKFFSKSAKQGYLLDCSDDIIRQIPTMERIPTSVLICAQASVFRAMERKWFPRYMETYPVDADYPPPEHTETSLVPSPTFADLTEELVINKEALANKKKSPKKRKTLHLWHGFVHLIMDFMDALRDEYEFKLLELYLRNEQEKDTKQKKMAEKSMLTSSTIASFQTRVVLRNRLVIVNKLVADLNFWNEVQKFKKHIDEISTRDNITKEDVEFLQLKAKSIIDCYLISEVLPRVQVNIPSDLATSIAVSLTQSGPTRGLFHDAMILIFPLLYYFWRRFRDEWLKGHDPKDFYFRLKEKMTVPWVSSTPHKDQSGPNYLNVRESQCQMMAVHLHEDEPFRINFSIMGGIRYMFTNRPATKGVTVPTVEQNARRQQQMRRSRRDSVNRVHKTHTEETAHGERRLSKVDMRKKSKIILEDEESVRNLDEGDAEVKSEKSQEIQKAEGSTESSATTLSPRRRRQSTAPIVQREKAFRLSQLVEELNTESDRPIAQRLRTLDQVVRAALTTQTRSQFTDDSPGSVTSLLI